MFNHSSIATIIIANNNRKVRIQSDSFDSIYLLLTELDRLARRENSSLNFKYNSDLPLMDLSTAIEQRL